MQRGQLQNTFYTSLGMVANIMGLSPLYCQYPVASITLWIEPAIRHGHIHFFRDEAGIPIGYVTWALLNKDTEHRLIHDPDVLLHISEWNEGSSLWIMDFVLLGGGLRIRLRETAALFGEYSCAQSLRRRDDGTVRKVSTWQRARLATTFPLQQ